MSLSEDECLWFQHRAGSQHTDPPSLLRCLRGPHLLPLPLTPVGPERLGQPRLSVPGNT